MTVQWSARADHAGTVNVNAVALGLRLPGTDSAAHSLAGRNSGYQRH